MDLMKIFLTGASIEYQKDAQLWSYLKSRGLGKYIIKVLSFQTQQGQKCLWIPLSNKGWIKYV